MEGALLGEQIDAQLSGSKSYRGILTDLSSDILVLFNGQQFLYFPMLHVFRFKQGTDIDIEKRGKLQMWFPFFLLID